MAGQSDELRRSWQLRHLHCAGYAFFADLLGVVAWDRGELYVLEHPELTECF